MMREFTKSAMSFSWALSLFGVNKATDLLRPGRERKPDVFEPITQMAVNQMDESIRSIYRYGDSIQARMVDTAFCLMNPANMVKGDWNPTRWPCAEEAARPADNESPSQGRATK